ncbi:MAG: hypothetical protein NXY57DRAFT_1026154 [Lentinula lateritia]|uniref:Uncharacterized protein n=1 Tax=Lentinula lateritia TaxID=40482 RepID=A0ABQ8VE89_9AGAR|nr:MAG: hypothetical protein NXY57DRAFT_1026154 [Lentinula lateritia]KAJ4486442.1 hypothetical protein C8R41DRAFT_838365 [Lentinula lateritia]
MRNPTFTCLSLLLIFLLEWPLSISSAPMPPSGEGSSSSTSHKVDLRVHRFFDIDPTCNTRGVEIGLSDIFELAEVAQHISEDSVAYQHYFLSREQNPQELDIVRNMAKSILVNGNSNNKTTIECPAMDTNQGAMAHTSSSNTTSPWMKLYPLYFKFPTFASKSFDRTGWCTPPPHNLVKFLSRGEIGYHELTHLEHIAKYALGLSSVNISDHRPNMDKRGTVDFFVHKSLTLYQSVRMLKDQWVAYLSQPNGATPKPQYYPDEVASSFELAAVETFFEQKCQAHGWIPTQVIPATVRDLQLDLNPLFDHARKQAKNLGVTGAYR